MSEAVDDAELEARVRHAMQALAASHVPDEASHGHRRARGARPSRRWLAVAVSVMVLGGVAALVVLPRGPDVVGPADSSTPTTAPTVTTVVPGGRPNADGDLAIDPSTLRFADPLADDVAAFIDDQSVSAPEESTNVVSGDGPGDESPDNVDVVVMDGARLMMRGAIVDIAADSIEISGPPVDIGVGGARYVDADEGAVAIPLGDDVRIVGPDEYFSFGGGGPHIAPRDLLAIAASVGDVAIDEVDDLAGFSVFDGSIDGVPLEPTFFTDSSVTVVHGQTPGSTTVTLHRLLEPPSALELIAITQALTRGSMATAAIGEVSFFDESDRIYLELVSPVDLLVVSGVDRAGALVDAVEFAPLDELE